MRLSRRAFLVGVAGTAGAALGNAGAALAVELADDRRSPGEISGAIVICNHWTQYGIGETFPAGELRGRWYRRNFSTVFGFEQGRRWLLEDPRNRVCHEFDAYFLEALAEEDPEFLAGLRDLLDKRLMELPGGTYGQAESQVFGYESALRQLTYGQAAYRRHLHRGVATYLVEEQSFYPQLPQLLKLAGFKYASIQFQNSGQVDPLPHDLILWEAPDGSAIPTVPNHPGMQSCARQWASYDEVTAQLRGRRAPLVFQWMELWPPGLDWGASVAPYRQAIHALEAQGYRQMLLTEYLEWALGRCETPRTRIALDRAHYDNNFFQGGWGYENEKTARGSNRCESRLMAAETLCAGRGAPVLAKALESRLPELWSRLLISQNHDPYLAGSVPARVNGVQSFMSELAVDQLTRVERALREEGGLGRPLAASGEDAALFNPCAWPVNVPLLLELDTPVWPRTRFSLRTAAGEKLLRPVFRSDQGNVLVGPVWIALGPYATMDLALAPASGAPDARDGGAGLLLPERDGRAWRVAEELMAGIEFEPLVGQWRQIPSYFTEKHPNINLEFAHEDIAQAPVQVVLRTESDGLDTAAWRRDLMRIREVPEPALGVEGLAIAGRGPVPFVQFHQRLTGGIRFKTGPRPSGTWRFAVRGPSAGLRLVADSPFCEEERTRETFYCSRYVRLEWPGRHLLWCPSQNTLFRKIVAGEVTTIECTVFDFEYSGQASWDMRFHVAPSFTAAASMRLAEAFHRAPLQVARQVTAGRVAGVEADNPLVVLNHVFPLEDGAVGVRALNASDAPQVCLFKGPQAASEVAAADLDGHAPPNSWRTQIGPKNEWTYSFRPWEIATFRAR